MIDVERYMKFAKSLKGKNDDYEKRLAEREYLKLVEQSNIPLRYKNCSFETLESNPQIEKIKKTFLPEIRNLKGRGLILTGSVGTGKTSIAIAVMKSAMAKNVSAFYEVSSSIFRNIIERGDDYRRCLLNKKILVIDDFHIPTNESELKEIDNIICERYNNNKSIIITTNISLTDIADNFSNRIVDRLRSECTTIKFEGKSRRT